MYLTVGRLLGHWGWPLHASERRFLLQEPAELATDDAKKLHCTYFVIDRPYPSYPVGTNIRLHFTGTGTPGPFWNAPFGVVGAGASAAS